MTINHLEAAQILDTIERRMRPSKSPFQGDDTARQDWIGLLANYTRDQIAAAFAAHRVGGAARWPDYYTFRDLLKRARSQDAHPSNTSHDNCDECQGTGWMAGNDFTVKGRPYTSVKPCNCPRGALTERSELWTQYAIGLCDACNGNGYHAIDDTTVERCDKCGASGILRP